jgi:hypothetical protein
MRSVWDFRIRVLSTIAAPFNCDFKNLDMGAKAIIEIAKKEFPVQV